jgi:hypothetical protein
MGSRQVHQGSLEKVSPSTLITDIFRGRFTGILTLEQGKRKKSLFIKGGSVIFADSTDMEDRLGQVLVRGDRITEDKISAALAIQRKDGADDKQLLGAILVQEGLIQPLDLVWAVKTQVEGIFCDCFLWTAGTFAFAEEDAPESWPVITLDLSMPVLLRMALNMVEDPITMANLLGDFSQLVDVSAQWMEMVERFKLQPLEFDLLGRAQAGADTLATLILASPYPAAATGRGTLLLNCLGVITLSPAS